jgi:hypothetical protein
VRRIDEFKIADEVAIPRLDAADTYEVEVVEIPYAC